MPMLRFVPALLLGLSRLVQVRPAPTLCWWQGQERDVSSGRGCSTALNVMWVEIVCYLNDEEKTGSDFYLFALFVWVFLLPDFLHEKGGDGAE